jgi:signal transduction histidine kinase
MTPSSANPGWHHNQLERRCGEFVRLQCQRSDRPAYFVDHPGQSQGRRNHHYRAHQARRTNRTFRQVRIRKDKTSLDISLTISPVREASGKIIGASKIARDITQRKRIERELRDSEERYRTLADALDTQVHFRTRELERRNSELRELSARLMESQDAERRHIARELHDSAGQTLAALGMNLAQLAGDTKANPAQAKNIADAEGLFQHLSREIRTTSYLLHPPLLDESGLASALDWYVHGLKERSGLDVELMIPAKFDRLPADMELVIFRIVQESLTNVHRHSGTKNASIRVARQGDKIVVEVQDRGKGMSPEKLAEIQSQGSGVGISGMRERLRHFRGELIVESNGAGTKIVATVPSKALPAEQQVVVGQQRDIA